MLKVQKWTEAWKLVGFSSLVEAELEVQGHAGTTTERGLVGREQCTKHRKEEEVQHIGTNEAQLTYYVEWRQESLKWK